MIAEYAPGAIGTSSRPADLAKVVSADPDLLALEFDALMAANYPDFADRPDPRPPRRTARLLTRRGNRVGALYYGERVDGMIPARKIGRAHV